MGNADEFCPSAARILVQSNRQNEENSEHTATGSHPAVGDSPPYTNIASVRNKSRASPRNPADASLPRRSVKIVSVSESEGRVSTTLFTPRGGALALSEGLSPAGLHGNCPAMTPSRLHKLSRRIIRKNSTGIIEFSVLLPGRDARARLDQRIAIFFWIPSGYLNGQRSLIEFRHVETRDSKLYFFFPLFQTLEQIFQLAPL